MTRRTTIRLPEELKARAMRVAAAERRSLSSLIEEAPRSLIEHRQALAAPRLMPRASTAKGGLAPDITSLRGIEELEDAEYTERLRRL